MRFAFYIAKRYFFSRKSTNVINLISFITLIGIAFGAGALIVVLSIFNGFERMAFSMLNAFNPDLKIISTKGKYFNRNIIEQVLDSAEGIEAWSFVLVENTLIEYENKQYIAYAKGVDDNFVKVVGIDTMIINGEFALYYKSRPMAIVGSMIARNINMQLNFLGSLKLWLPKPRSRISMNIVDMFVRTHIFPAGVFAIHQDFDTKFIFVPLDFLQNSLELDKNLVSACEIKLSNDADIQYVKTYIKNSLGESFVVRDRLEQERMFYKIVKSERLAIIMILTFIIVIASFNVIATISMLIIDKKQDIKILNFLGADPKTLKKIFLNQGFIINSLGIVLGIVIGLAIVLFQKYFGIIKFPSTSTLTYLSYPVVIKYSDIAITIVIVSFVGYFSSLIPVNYFINKYFGNE